MGKVVMSIKQIVWGEPTSSKAAAGFFFYTNFIAQTCEHVRPGLPGPRGAGGWPVLPPELTPAAVLHDDPSKSPLLGLPNVEAVPIAGPVLSSLKVQ